VSSTYHVKISSKAIKQLQKLEFHAQTAIVNWLEDNLEGCTNPREKGSSLTQHKSAAWRYRVGDYRLLANIIDAEVRVEVVKIGHRRNVYR